MIKLNKFYKIKKNRDITFLSTMTINSFKKLDFYVFVKYIFDIFRPF